MLGTLSLTALLTTAVSTQAQWLSTWGHPVITLGLTPYDSTNTGHGNYPGGPGFIPGYGYYPGAGPGHYPWLDGPGVPFDRRKLAPPEPMSAPPGAAVIIVKLPTEAELWFDGSKTSQGGSYRCFITPPLPESSRPYSYTVRAHWRLRDVELTRTEEVLIQPGGQYTINFLTVDSWTGRRLLPQ
jgi:uncharacterized protein (TIGR03000 family)